MIFCVFRVQRPLSCPDSSLPNTKTPSRVQTLTTTMECRILVPAPVAILYAGGSRVMCCCRPHILVRWTDSLVAHSGEGPRQHGCCAAAVSTTKDENMVARLDPDSPGPGASREENARHIFLKDMSGSQWSVGRHGILYCRLKMPQESVFLEQCRIRLQTSSGQNEN